MYRLIRKTVSFYLAIICLVGFTGCHSGVTATPDQTTSTTPAVTISSRTSQASGSSSTVRPTATTSRTAQPTVTTAATASKASSTAKPTTVTEKGPVRKPKIVVRKSDRVLELWDGDQLYGSYRIGLGFTPLGHKQVEGDGKTPEGEYFVCTRNGNSRFYLALGVSYPNIKDAEAGLADGRIDQPTMRQIREAIESKLRPPWNTPLGGEIMIHGHGSQSDWTAGCVAVDNEVMDILWKYCPLKTPIIIKP